MFGKCMEKLKVAGTFKLGDLVILKAGGPVMAVQSVFPDGEVRAQWFSGKKLESGIFNEATLLPAPKEGLDL
jgi:uncharacterized protein YodC (DUF2158 family)